MDGGRAAGSITVVPAAVSVATKQNLPSAAANGAVGLVTIIVIHVGYLQVHVLITHTSRRTSDTSGTFVSWFTDDASVAKQLLPSDLARLAQASFKQRVKGRRSHLPTRQTEFCKRPQTGQYDRSGWTVAPASAPHLLYFVCSSKLHSPFVLRGKPTHLSPTVQS